MQLSQQVKPIPPTLSASFPRYGPLIATFLVVISGHTPLILDDPLRFLQGLITPSIIFPMLGMMLFALIFGYILGIIPTFLTRQVVQHLIRPHLTHATQKTVLFHGACAAMVWSPLLLFGLFDVMAFLTIAWFLFCVILPTSLFCSWLEWRKLNTAPK